MAKNQNINQLNETDSITDADLENEVAYSKEEILKMTIPERLEKGIPAE